MCKMLTRELRDAVNASRRTAGRDETANIKVVTASVSIAMRVWGTESVSGVARGVGRLGGGDAIQLKAWFI